MNEEQVLDRMIDVIVFPDLSIMTMAARSKKSHFGNNVKAYRFKRETSLDDISCYAGWAWDDRRVSLKEHRIW